MLDVVLYILIFCIGTLFGSFFTLAVYRIPIGKDITHERSFCPNCNHKLSFLDMIPILSYVFLGGKCRYCKNKIRIRYLLLEVFTGLVFTLFAISINLSLYNIQISKMVYFVFGILYITTIFIIAGIDKEKIKIEKRVLLFGIIIQTLYIIYLYIVEKDPSIYRYVIYLLIILILQLIQVKVIRKQGNFSYTLDILSLSMLMVLYTYEYIFFISIVITLIIILLAIIIKKCKEKNVRTVKKDNNQEIKLPIGYYLCISNIICLVITNMYIFGLK